MSLIAAIRRSPPQHEDSRSLPAAPIVLLFQNRIAAAAAGALLPVSARVGAYTLRRTQRSGSKKEARPLFCRDQRSLMIHSS